MDKDIFCLFKKKNESTFSSRIHVPIKREYNVMLSKVEVETKAVGVICGCEGATVSNIAAAAAAAHKPIRLTACSNSCVY